MGLTDKKLGIITYAVSRFNGAHRITIALGLHMLITGLFKKALSYTVLSVQFSENRVFAQKTAY